MGDPAARPYTHLAGTYYEPTTHRDARILLLSERNTFVHMWEAPQMEFEDVIMAVDRVDLLAPVERKRGMIERAAVGIKNRVAPLKDWAIDVVEIDRDYDLFFATFHFPPNISYIRKLRGLRRRCKKMVCFLVEMWSPQVDKFGAYLELLEVFDQVLVFNGATVDLVAQRVGRPCAFMPTATDLLRFTPAPVGPERTIDVYALGRSSASAHAQLLDMAEHGEIFYAFANVNHHLPDFRAHRLLVANMIKRTRYFVAYAINENRRALTGGDEALATRYFEGAAGGAVMIGSAPATRDFYDNFDWSDAVIPVPFEHPNLRAVLADLDAQPERMAAARRNNVMNSLLRHDWVHRWAQVLDSVGLAHTPEMADRVRRLELLAEQTAFAPPPDIGFQAVTPRLAGAQ